MRILISADMEGVSGVVHTTETNPDKYDYARGRALMTAEVNAVIDASWKHSRTRTYWSRTRTGRSGTSLPKTLTGGYDSSAAAPARSACWAASTRARTR